MNWPIEKRIRAGFGAMLLLLLVLGVVSFWGATRAIRTYQSVDHTHQVSEELERALASMLDAQAAFDNYLLSGEPQFRKSYEASIQQAVAGLETLRGLTRDNPRQQTALNRLQPLLTAEAAGMSAQLDARPAPETAARSRLPPQGNRGLTDMRHVPREMQAEELRLLKERSVRAQAEAYTTIAFGCLGTIVTMTVAALANLFVHRGFLKQQRAETSIRRLNAHLEKQSVQLKDANRELEAFSYSVSHDLRAPLRAIEGFSSALAEDCADGLSPQGKEDLERVRTAARRMGQLMEDLLGLARVTRTELRRAPVNLSELAEAILAGFRKSEPEREVEVSIAPQLVADADASLMQIALENLLSNAWKFTGRCERARLEFGAAFLDGQRVYHVRDNGAGFDMAYATRLFGAFQRLHSATEFKGTGVGLATVQRIIHRHAGRIWAESQIGQGATFYFTLPALPVERAEG